MSQKNIWKVFCVEEDVFVPTKPLEESRIPDFCPNNAAHTITAARSVITRVVSKDIDNIVVARSTGEVVTSRQKGETVNNGLA